MGKAQKRAKNKRKKLDKKASEKLEFENKILSMKDDLSYAIAHNDKYLPFGHQFFLLGKTWKEFYGLSNK